MKKLILGTLMLFSSAIIAQNEYEESSFQGAEEAPMGLVLKESDLVGGAWQAPSGLKYGFYPSQKHLMLDTKGKIWEMLWDVKGNYFRIFNPQYKSFVMQTQVVSKGNNTISVMKEDGVIYDWKR